MPNHVGPGLAGARSHVGFALFVGRVGGGLAEHVAGVVEVVGREVRQNAVLHRVVALVRLVQVGAGKRNKLPHEQQRSGHQGKK